MNRLAFIIKSINFRITLNREVNYQQKMSFLDQKLFNFGYKFYILVVRSVMLIAAVFIVLFACFWYDCLALSFEIIFSVFPKYFLLLKAYPLIFYNG